jgi:hypothetical protein
LGWPFGSCNKVLLMLVIYLFFKIIIFSPSLTHMYLLHFNVTYRIGSNGFAKN